MKLADGRTLIVIGENIHTTRVVLRKGRRFVDDGDRQGVRYTGTDGAERLLPVPDWAKRGQDYQEGRVKHVMIAVRAAMAGAGAEAAQGMDYIARMVSDLEGAGADYLDLNVDEISIKLADQKAAIAWLVRTVQSLTALPLSVDSSNLEVIEAGLAACDGARARPLLNSASLERIDALDLAAAAGAQVVVTAAGDSGMPDGVAQRLDNASRMVEAARAKGFALSDIFIDPLLFPVSVDTVYGPHGLDAIRALRARFGPDIHITGGMSNVSFGIPARKVINEVFLLLALEAGADSGIIDPVASPPQALLAIDRSSPFYKLAEDVILDRDKHCRNFIRAWRKGELAPLAAGA